MSLNYPYIYIASFKLVNNYFLSTTYPNNNNFYHYLHIKVASWSTWWLHFLLSSRAQCWCSLWPASTSFRPTEFLRARRRAWLWTPVPSPTISFLLPRAPPLLELLFYNQMVRGGLNIMMRWMMLPKKATTRRLLERFFPCFFSKHSSDFGQFLMYIDFSIGRINQYVFIIAAKKTFLTVRLFDKKI